MSNTSADFTSTVSVSPELLASLSRLESKLAYIEYDIARRRHLPPMSVWRIGFGVALGLFIAAFISTLLAWLLTIAMGLGALAALKSLSALLGWGLACIL